MRFVSLLFISNIDMNLIYKRMINGVQNAWLLIRKFIFDIPISVFESEGLPGKIIIAYLIANALTPFWLFINKYVFSDWHYLLYLMIVLSVDVAAGMIKHFKYKTFSLNKFLHKFTYNKIVPIGLLLIFFHAMEYGIAIDKEHFGQEYMAYLKHTMLLVYLGGSIILNVYYISDGKIPPKKVMEKFGITDEMIKTGNPNGEA